MPQSNSFPAKVWRILVGLKNNPRGGTIWLMFRIMKSLIAFSRYGKVTFYPRDRLPWIPELESNWKVIRSELDGILVNLRDVPNAQDAYAQGELTQDDKWKTYTLVRSGRKSEQALGQCPETLKLLERIPGLSTAMFSIIGPKKHLAAHHGPYAGLLNCHLGLLVPPKQTDCRIRVGNDIASWDEGRLMAFDESNEHEVWNDSDSIRVVMLMYVVRPLPFPLSALNRLVMGVGTLLARKLQAPNTAPA